MEPVLPPTSPGPLEGISGPYIHVEQLEVKLSQSGHEVVVLVAGQGQNTNGGTLALVLTPPAARTLSRKLRREIRGYLRGPKDQK